MAEPNTVPPSRPLFTANPALQSLRMSTSRQPFIAHSPLEPFTSWFSGKTKIPDDKPTELPTASTDALDIHHLASSVYTEITSSPAAVAALSATSATTLTLISVVVYRKYIKRIRNADYVTSGMIQERKWIKGIVTRAASATVFRKVPTEAKGRSIFPALITDQYLKDETIHIRIAGVDAPEASLNTRHNSLETFRQHISVVQPSFIPGNP
ncbi:hypothetical protein QFC20_001984 [Naganishia adeliensis]|uniref:Uncharacterized protein n=1 Tax=Naganishia adeliensis TaxID=92952 RepID=A0ACC2WPW5_9TREE|nr:hypothetical protein QFC20_001984 [Naganishia adeliensis]